MANGYVGCTRLNPHSHYTAHSAAAHSKEQSLRLRLREGLGWEAIQAKASANTLLPPTSATSGIAAASAAATSYQLHFYSRHSCSRCSHEDPANAKVRIGAYIWSSRDCRGGGGRGGGGGGGGGGGADAGRVVVVVVVVMVTTCPELQKQQQTEKQKLQQR